ncbi:DMT family transporter [Aestuariibacter salexigens]|uniref:DMT family transporter n=1 Tax=Aestuariibacter salexigens TaxID=226010 RepID=UPI0004120B22|nr:DMT family transporter [Aestuariibacter salexigens]
METQERPLLGFLLALLTATMWGALPVALTLTLQEMDSPTITWYRFLLAAVFVATWLAFRNKLPAFGTLSPRFYIVVFLATVGLVGNYILNLYGLLHINPETVQVLTQLAPFVLMMGGIVFYGERFTKLEGVGALVLFSGLLLFFNHNLELLFSGLNDYSIGVLFIIGAALTWAGYALVQKRLLKTVTSKQLTLLIYVFGALLLLPFASLSDIQQLNSLQFWALMFCCLNTLVAYGAFTEALHVWQAAKVSAVIALAPLFTFLAMEGAVRVWPNEFVASDLDVWAYIGAAMVMIGSITAALGRLSFRRTSALPVVEKPVP